MMSWLPEPIQIFSTWVHFLTSYWLMGIMFLQLINSDGGQEVERAESAVSESCDITTATSNLSDEVSGDLTAERRRELWRRAHAGPENRDVRQTANISLSPPKRLFEGCRISRCSLKWAVNLSVSRWCCHQPMTVPLNLLHHQPRAQPWDWMFTPHLTTLSANQVSLWSESQQSKDPVWWPERSHSCFIRILSWKVKLMQKCLKPALFLMASRGWFPWFQSDCMWAY